MYFYETLNKDMLSDEVNQNNLVSRINIERNFFNEKDKEAKINMLAVHLHSYIHYSQITDATDFRNFVLNQKL